MLAISAPFPFYQDIDGSPLDDGDLYFGTAGLNPETNPITVYWDLAGTQPAAQPVMTLNGFAVRSGTPAQIFAPTDYSLNVRNRRGVLVSYTANSMVFGLASQVLAQTVTTLGLSSGSSLIGFIQSGAGAVATTEQARGRLEVWSADYGHLPTASAAANDAALIAAVAAVSAAGGGTVHMGHGTYQHITVPFGSANVAGVNLMGEGKLSTVLQKSGSTTTPVLDISVTTLTQAFTTYSDFSIVGSSSLSPGLRTTLLAIFTLRNIGISACSVGWDNLGSLIASVYDTDLRGNAKGYNSARTLSGAQQIYPNLITFFGGQVIGNTAIGFDIVHGSGITWDHVDIEQNGVFGNTATGGIFIRSTTNLEISYATFTITNNCWFESNHGTPLTVENAAGILLTVNGGTKFVRNIAAADSALAMSIGTIESSVIENVFALSSLSGNLVVQIAASRSLVKGSLIGTLTDNSGTFNHIEVGTSTEVIQCRYGNSGGGRANISPVGLDISNGGVNAGGTKISLLYTIADTSGSTVTTTINVGTLPNVYGVMVFVRGRNISNGISFSRLYLVSIRISGGGGSDVASTTVSSGGDATPAFTFDNNAGFLRITQATGSGGIASIVGG